MHFFYMLGYWDAWGFFLYFFFSTAYYNLDGYASRRLVLFLKNTHLVLDIVYLVKYMATGEVD